MAERIRTFNVVLEGLSLVFSIYIRWLTTVFSFGFRRYEDCSLFGHIHAHTYTK